MLEPSYQIQQVDGFNDNNTPSTSENNETGNEIMQVDGINDTHSSNSDSDETKFRTKIKLSRTAHSLNKHKGQNDTNVDQIESISTELEKLNIGNNRDESSSMDSNSYISDNLILGTLSFTDLENIEKKIDPESIKRFLKLKEQYQVRKTAHESCEINEQIYDSMADTNPDLQLIANKAKSLTGNLKDELDSIETKIRVLTNIGAGMLK